MVFDSITQAQTPDQDSEVIIVPAGDTFLRWTAKVGRTYFIQGAPNLDQWQWSDLIETGDGQVISHEVGSTSGKAFFRLWHTDDPIPHGVTPEDWDADADGLSNYQEVATHQTHPLNADTSGDGIPDGWAVFFGLDPLADNASAPFQGGPESCLVAFNAGVQPFPGATLNDHDGDQIPNDGDSNPKAIDEFRLVVETTELSVARDQGGETTTTTITTETFSVDRVFLRDPEFQTVAPIASVRHAPAGGDLTTSSVRVEAVEAKSHARTLTFFHVLDEVWWSILSPDPDLTVKPKVVFSIGPQQTVSQVVEIDPGVTELTPTTGVIDKGAFLMPVEEAPDVLAVNSDFDEGRIDPTTGYAIPDCDDPDLELEAVRDHLDLKFKVNEVITEDMHEGWFGVNPGKFFGDAFLNGAEVTIRKIDKIDPATGHRESGQVRFYAKWGNAIGENCAIAPYDFDTLQPVNLVAGGIPFDPSKSVYGANRVSGDYFMEGVHPGKITLEWKFKKGAFELVHEQSFEVLTKKTAFQWRVDLNYKIRLETDGDPSGQIFVEGIPLPSEGYWTRTERICEYYDFYRECFIEPLRSNPTGYPNALSWAGLARLAGSQVIGGLSDSDYGKTVLVAMNLAGLPAPDILNFITGWTVPEIDATQQALFSGARQIFTSIGWQHHAYRSSGYRAIDYVAGLSPADPHAFALAASWKDLHQGVLDHDVSLLNDAALKMTDREQNVVIVPTWTIISGLALGLADDVFSILGKNPCTPSGLDFTDLFSVLPGGALPVGSLANTADRWHWIDSATAGGILTTWNAHPLATKLSLVGDDLVNDAGRFSIFSSTPPTVPGVSLPILSRDHLDVP